MRSKPYNTNVFFFLNIHIVFIMFENDTRLLIYSETHVQVRIHYLCSFIKSLKKKPNQNKIKMPIIFFQ